jgi:hypothetical protein
LNRAKYYCFRQKKQILWIVGIQLVQADSLFPSYPVPASVYPYIPQIKPP